MTRPWDAPTFDRHRRAVLRQLRHAPAPLSPADLATRLGLDTATDIGPLWLLLTALHAGGKVSLVPTSTGSGWCRRQ